MDELNTSAGEYTHASGLGSRRARGAMIAVGALFVLYEVLRGIPAEQPWVWASYAAGIGGALVLTVAGHTPLSPRRAALLVALALATGAALWAQPGSNPRSWIYSYAAYLLALLIARGNRVAGGIGGALLLLMGVFVLVRQEASYADAVALLDVAVTALAAGYIWRWWFRRMVAREQRLLVEIERSRREAAAAQASVASMRAAYASVHELAAPLLTSLSAAEPITDASRRSLGIAEAEIRDTLVAPRLANSELRGIIRALRERGAQVLLLGHEGTDGGQRSIAPSLIASLVSELRATVDPAQVTLREHPPGGGVAYSLLVVDARGRTRQRYTELGDPAPAPAG